MKQFDNIDDVKAACEFFPKGRIIPQRILHVQKRKYRCRKFFGSDSWAMPTPSGYIVLVDCNKSGSAIHLRSIKNSTIKGSVYTTNGETVWIGNFERTDEKWLEVFASHYNKAFKE